MGGVYNMLTEDVKKQLNRGRMFLHKVGLAQQYKLGYVDKRADSSEQFKSYYTISKRLPGKKLHRLFSGYTVDEVMKKLIGDDKYFLTAWRNTGNGEVYNHPFTDIQYKEMQKAVKELGITKFKIKKMTDERAGQALGRCYGFYEKVMNKLYLTGRSVEIGDFITYIAQRDPDTASRLAEQYQKNISKY